MATSLEESKNNFRLIIYSRSFSDPENLAKIGLVDFEIIGLTRIVKNKKPKQNMQPAVPAFSSQVS